MKPERDVLTRTGNFYRWVTGFSRVKKILILAVIAALVYGGFRVFSPKKTAQQYQTGAVEKGLLVVSVSASGTVSSSSVMTVSTQGSGVVKSVSVKNGDYVEAGSPIAELSLDLEGQQRQAAAYASYLNAVNSQKTAQQNKLALQSQLEQNRQSVLDAQNTVDTKNTNSTNPSTKKEYTELEKLSIDSNLTSARETFTATERKYLDADNAINAANASLTSTWLAYQQTSAVITAPVSGTIAGMSVQPGSVITQSSSSSSNTASSQKIATISTGGTPSVTINLTEVDVPKVAVGNKATLTFDAFPDKTFTGHVSSIDTAGSVSSGVTTYPTTITLDSDESSIYANMSVSANIITKTKDNVLLVPSAAVQTSNGESYVRVMKNGAVSEVTVEVGDSSDTQTEIVSGLKEGDTVVTSVTSSGATNSTGTSPFSSFGGARRTGFGAGGATFRIAR